MCMFCSYILTQYLFHGCFENKNSTSREYLFLYFCSWSYGILLWEVFTLGGSPYPGLRTEELISFLEEGRRMDCPEICPKSIYEIMLDCWKKNPYDRPLFVQITERLNNILRQNVSSVCLVVNAYYNNYC